MVESEPASLTVEGPALVQLQSKGVSAQKPVTQILIARGRYSDNVEAGIHVVHLTCDGGC